MSNKTSKKYESCYSLLLRENKLTDDYTYMESNEYSLLRNANIPQEENASFIKMSYKRDCFQKKSRI